MEGNNELTVSKSELTLRGLQLPQLTEGTNRHVLNSMVETKNMFSLGNSLGAWIFKLLNLIIVHNTL